MSGLVDGPGTAGCLSVSEFPAVPLAIRDGREPMRSIGARQRVLCFGYLPGQANESHSRSSAKPQVKIHAPLIQAVNDSGRTSFITHQFIEPSVSHCRATPFRLLVQTKGSKEKDARVTRRRYAPNHCDARAEGCGKNSGGFGRPQTPCRTGAVRRKPFGPVLLVRFTRGPNTDG